MRESLDPVILLLAQAIQVVIRLLPIGGGPAFLVLHVLRQTLPSSCVGNDPTPHMVGVQGPGLGAAVHLGHEKGICAAAQPADALAVPGLRLRPRHPCHQLGHDPELLSDRAAWFTISDPRPLRVFTDSNPINGQLTALRLLADQLLHDAQLPAEFVTAAEAQVEWLARDSYPQQRHVLLVR